MDAHFMLYLWGFFQSKIVRVLNLWQKNGVFMSEVIQPLLDLTADPNNPDLAAQGM